MTELCPQKPITAKDEVDIKAKTTADSDTPIIRVKDFFINEREFIIYHQHRQQTMVEDLLMEAPDEEVRLPTPPNDQVCNTQLNINQLNGIGGNQRSGIDSSLFLSAGAGVIKN